MDLEADARATSASSPARRVKRRGPTIWAVGGGKGGVGKSILSTNLAIAFARAGRRTVLVDLDLGGANLHSLLGLASPRWTLSHFLDRKLPQLADALCPTSHANLSLVSGARAGATVANLQHSQKLKLVRHIRSLDAEHVLLDLGAGAAYNALDFFLAAKRKLLVVAPEPTSIENTQYFLKASFFRCLRSAARDAPVRAALAAALEQGARGSPRELLRKVESLDPSAFRALAEQAVGFAPMIVVNQAANDSQRRVGEAIARDCRFHLGVQLLHLGSLPRDECVRSAVGQSKPVVDLYPGAPFSTALIRLSRRLLQGHDFRVPAPTQHFAQPKRPLPPLDASAPGAYLRRCREQLGRTLSELAQHTRIRSLANIEDERFEELPPEQYVEAFVRQYARALGIRDAEFLARRYVHRYREALAG